MNNFLDFINEDIETKRTLLTTLPTKTNTNKKKFNETLDSMIKKYDTYAASVRNYMLAKSRSFALKNEDCLGIMINPGEKQMILNKDILGYLDYLSKDCN